jgi:hypothetical protein
MPNCTTCLTPGYCLALEGTRIFPTLSLGRLQVISKYALGPSCNPLHYVKGEALCWGHYSTGDTQRGGREPDAEGISRGGMPAAQGLSLRNAQRMRQNLPTDTRWPGNSKNITRWPGHSGNKEPALCTLHNIRRALRLWNGTCAAYGNSKVHVKRRSETLHCPKFKQTHWALFEFEKKILKRKRNEGFVSKRVRICTVESERNSQDVRGAVDRTSWELPNGMEQVVRGGPKVMGGLRNSQTYFSLS